MRLRSCTRYGRNGRMPGRLPATLTVLFQAAVPVEPGDDEDRLHGRIKQEEHRLLPLAVRLVAEGRVRVEGRRARIVAAEEVAR